MVDNAKVSKSDIMADNGVVHVIDTVLISTLGASPEPRRSVSLRVAIMDISLFLMNTTMARPLGR